jgi:erythromycin esterase-like protein
MSLKYNITAEEHGGLDEGIKSLYTEKDDGYVLAVEGIEDTPGLKSALAKERELAKEYKKQAAAWEALGKKPEEISEILKQLEKQKQEPPKANLDDKEKGKEPPKDPKEPNPFEELAKKVEAQLAAQQAEMAALRKEQAEKNEREKKRERDARVYKEFEGYPEEQKAALVRLVEGDKDE